MALPYDWRGQPIPPSQLQALLRDDPLHRAYGGTFGHRPGRSLARSFEHYLEAQLQTAVASWEDIFRFLKSCLYARDREIHGRDEIWIHPEDFERHRAGDCEDSALWAWVQFHRLGWESRFTAGFHEGTGHAWVTLYREGEVRVCETTARKESAFLLDASRHPEYEPVWSVDGGVRFFLHGGAP